MKNVVAVLMQQVLREPMRQRQHGIIPVPRRISERLVPTER
ncbi:MAG: hypothetical protein JWM95_5040, partial [Gemmatimonadetes bacterium]|nr:hypothetical protein [Gemmatimonadota bacterium]